MRKLYRALNGSLLCLCLCLILGLMLVTQRSMEVLQTPSSSPIKELSRLQHVYQWKREEMKFLIQQPSAYVAPHDPILVDLILADHIRQPNQGPKSQKLLDVIKDPKIEYGGQYEQSLIVDKHFQGKRNGFFIEAGAWNGAYLSNSLFLEVERNWTGLLVEANTKAFEHLLALQRRAFSFHGCLSISNQSAKVTFDGADVFGTIKKNKSDLTRGEAALEQNRAGLDKNHRSTYVVQCFPLYSLLLALGNPEVDYFSLDVEGSEMDVLRTIPWDKVRIKTLTIEVEHSDAQMITTFMETNGYSMVQKIGKVDLFFVRNS
ncbi:protein Star-like [Tigriopus californicus]|nr:protein Star-like [Tigriopus californicus]XP_059088627.1 protein Star-like [Tigriopus californicus]XP_059088635.1 protein Star-like [Tigriopus californicus]XP_059088643.1 protein Star-like [Tigriopus californicus]|eukprot:TCALIF_09352-PA protein Name:"Similar to S Protein Star (Drosophila melanogaster)" AED:0.04 eAED:0.04 QI:169/1/0.66/1/1/1/3/0/317